MLDVVTEYVREGLLSELLYAGNLVLMSEIIDGLRYKFLKWRESFRSKGLWVNLGKTKVVVVVVSSSHQLPRCGVWRVEKVLAIDSVSRWSGREAATFIRIGKTKVMVSSGITKDGLSKCKVDACGVYSLGVKGNSKVLKKFCMQRISWQNWRGSIVGTNAMWWCGNCKGIHISWWKGDCRWRMWGCSD